MISASRRAACGLLLASLLAAGPAPLAPAAQPLAQPEPADNLEPLITATLADVSEHERFYSIRWCKPLLEQREAFLIQQLSALMAKSDQAVTPSQRVDFLLLRNQLRDELSGTRLAMKRLAEMAPLLPFGDLAAGLERARWAMENTDSKAAAGTLEEITRQVKIVEAALDRGRDNKPESEGANLKPSPVTALRASRAIDGLRRALRTWFDDHAGFIPEFEFWCRQPFQRTDAAMDRLAKRLREEIARIKGEDEDPLIGDPIGREALVEALRNEFVALSPEEMLAMGDAEMAWCQEQMKAASRELGLGDDWHAALERAKNSSEPVGTQDQYVRDVSREAIDFVTSRELVTVPELSRAFWRTDMVSPRTQRVLPFAAYGGQAMLVAYPHASQEHGDKLMAQRGNNRHATRIVVPHELIPGHHLQAFYSARNRAYRRPFSTPFYVEGWALYWEMKLWDLGWAKPPLDRVGMLFWRMHRCARITVSLKFHLGQMTPQQMVDYLVTEVGHERANATAEVRRYVGDSYGPLYQAGYMTGGKQLRELHNEVVGTGKLSEKAFNDAILRAGTLPIELLRAEMLGLKLDPTAEATWKFGYGQPTPSPAPAPTPAPTK
jgi:hypothetical protein